MSTAATMTTQPTTVTNPGNVGIDSTNMSSQRSNRPRPLKLDQIGSSDSATKFRSSGLSFAQPTEPMSAEEILDLMQTIHTSVKGGHFNSQLATEIFRLYQQLKIQGQQLEQLHKNELNRVFVSLRQACCRDSGQLGTPCRLKIMELIELRAMGWRPNLAHSQYYLNRPSESQSTGATHGGQGSAGIDVSAGVSQSTYNPTATAGSDFDAASAAITAPAPISAPPFGTVPINPFAFAAPPPPPHHQPHFTMASMVSAHHHQMPPHMGMPTGQMELVTSNTAAGQPIMASVPVPASTSAAPSYYLIPASGAFIPHAMQQMQQMTVIPPPQSPIVPPFGMTHPPPPQQQHHHPQVQVPLGVQAIPTPQQQGSPPGSGGSTGSAESYWPKGAVVKPSGKYPRPQKVPGKNQFRDEIIIRNADSGKIMGVKGRRVAVVEEISKTVISFQKVVQGAKERILTITGNSEETIDRAKLLIEETIRRNVSPNRPEGETAEADEVIVGTEEGEERLERPEHGHDGVPKVTDINSNFTTVQALEGGFLKLSCEDPEMLQAAQQALNEYFTRLDPLRRSHGGGVKDMDREEREIRRERRKSMPSFSPESGSRAPIRSMVAPRTSGAADKDTNWRRPRRSSSPPEHLQSERGSAGKDGSAERLITDGSKLDALDDQTKGDPTVSRISRRPIGPGGQQGALAKSTPNLCDGTTTGGLDSGVATTIPSRFQLRVVYTKDYLLKCAASPLAEMTPGNHPSILKECPEILRPVPGKYSAAEYKERVAALKTNSSQL